MKNYWICFLLSLVLLLGFASCTENSEETELTKWKERNIAYIDSIADVVRNSNDGSWRRILDTGLDGSKDWDSQYYVYCKVLQAGDGTEHPAYTDTVSVNYRGCLIDGFIFDSSFDGELEPEFDVPVAMPLDGTVAGFSAAVQQMVAGSTPFNGDIWRVYIPAYLGYGVHETSGIPANSTLIFDINLVSFYRAK